MFKQLIYNGLIQKKKNNFISCSKYSHVFQLYFIAVVKRLYNFTKQKFLKIKSFDNYKKCLWNETIQPVINFWDLVTYLEIEN